MIPELEVIRVRIARKPCLKTDADLLPGKTIPEDMPKHIGPTPHSQVTMIPIRASLAERQIEKINVKLANHDIKTLVCLDHVEHAIPAKSRPLEIALKPFFRLKRFEGLTLLDILEVLIEVVTRRAALPV
jgi:hypothetical protein